MKTIAIGGRIKILPETVILLEADINYTKLYLANGKQIVVATTLKQLEKRFLVLQNFFRPHKSQIVNLNFITTYDLANSEITMQNHHTVFISRRRKTKFKNHINLIF